MWPKPFIDRPDDMAKSIVAESENVSISTVAAIADALLMSVLVPPAIPFVLVWAVAGVSLDKVGKWLARGGRTMPDDWYAHVEAMASSDGRFFVGRLLKEQGRVTMSDAMRFVAIEKWAEKREKDDRLLTDADAAKEALIVHYEQNRSAFDKAVAGVMSGVSTVVENAVGATIAGGVGMATAIKRKFDVGF